MTNPAIPSDLWDKASELRRRVNFNSNSAIEIIALALLEERDASRWQPIAGAPKNSPIAYLCYSPGNPRAHNEYAREPHFHIDGFSERWPRGRNQYPEAPYTHWMPLPSPPQEEA